MAKRRLFWTALVLIMVVIGAAAAWRYAGGTWPPAAAQTPSPQGAAPAGGSASGQRVIAVEAAEVKIGSITDEIRIIGTLRSNESVVIRPEIGGRITEILFEEGQQVAAGTPLVRLDAEIARAELDQAKAALALSETNHRRSVELFQRKAGSAATRDQSLAALRADQAAVQLAEARLAKLTLSAPFDGVLGLRQISLGDYVTPGQDIVNLEDIRLLKVDFRVPEIYLGSLKPGQTVTAASDAFPGQSFEGEVYAIDPLVDENGRAVALRARLPNVEELLRPGLFVEVALQVGRRDQVALIPEQALVPRGTDQFVFKVVDGKAVATTVKTGSRRNAMVEIVEGLAPGDTVVTAGQMKLRDGMAVTVLPPPSQS